jgi:hypothetical protein
VFNLSKPSTVTRQQLSEQFGHDYPELRRFRRFFIDSLKRVQSAYREAKLKVADAGVILLPSRPHLITHQHRSHQALNPERARNSLRATAIGRPACDMRSQSGFVAKLRPTSCSQWSRAGALVRRNRNISPVFDLTRCFI